MSGLVPAPAPAAGLRAVAAGPGSWKLTVPNGRSMCLRARIEDEWMCGRADLPMPEGSDALGLLEWTSHWPGPTRLGWDGTPRRIQLLRELPVRTPSRKPDTDALLESIAIDFPAARTSLAALGRDGSPGPVVDPETRSGDGQEASERAGWCRETGWTVSRSEGPDLAVDLGDGSGYYQARWLRNGDVESFAVSLSSLEASSRESIEAAAVLLLRTSEMIRLLRSRVRITGDGVVPQLEVRLDPAPSAYSLDVSLSALSVAVRMCGREVQALQDQALARDYLNLSGWPTPPDSENRRNDS